MDWIQYCLCIVLWCGLMHSGADAQGRCTNDHSADFGDAITWRPIASELSLYGTSNVRDWEVSADTLAGYMFIRNERTLTASFCLPARYLKSGYTVMDNTMYESLRYDEYPEISYHLDSVTLDNECQHRNTGVEGQDNADCLLRVHGRITAAGVEHGLEHVVQWKHKGDRIMLSGVIKLQMTDFGIDPPQYMGVLKTGDEVSIHYNLVMTRER